MLSSKSADFAVLSLGNCAVNDCLSVWKWGNLFWILISRFAYYTVNPCAQMHAFKPNEPDLDAALKVLFWGVKSLKLNAASKPDSLC